MNTADYLFRNKMKYGREFVEQVEKLSKHGETKKQASKTEQDFFNVPENVKDGYYNKAEVHENLSPEQLTKDKEIVYAFFKAYGPTYDNAIASFWGKPAARVSARRAKLMEEKRIVRNDDENGNPVRAYDAINQTWPITWKAI